LRGLRPAMGGECSEAAAPPRGGRRQSGSVADRPGVHRALPGSSVRAPTYSATPRVPPWSPLFVRFRRGRLCVRTPAPRRPAVTSAAAPRRRRSTESCRSASRAGLRIARPASSPSRATSKRSSAGISRAGCSASDSPALSARGAHRSSSWHFRASAGACARPATAGTWRRRRHISSTT
jgi:hypothetical protein